MDTCLILCIPDFAGEKAGDLNKGYNLLPCGLKEETGNRVVSRGYLLVVAWVCKNLSPYDVSRDPTQRGGLMRLKPKEGRLCY